MNKDTKTIKCKLIEKEQHISDIFRFSFEMNEIDWQAGQYAIFKFEDSGFENNMRVFSIASVPEENKISIGTRISETPSDFKAKLKSMEIGDIITITAPMGNFCIEDYKKPMLMIAGGIGITPIVSLLKSIEYKKIQGELIELLYIEDNKNYAYEKEIKSIESNFDYIKANLLDNRDELSNKLDNFRNAHQNNATYFISGAPGMVEFISGNLKKSGISDENIIKDVFSGYPE